MTAASRPAGPSGGPDPCRADRFLVGVRRPANWPPVVGRQPPVAWAGTTYRPILQSVSAPPVVVRPAGDRRTSQGSAGGEVHRGGSHLAGRHRPRRRLRRIVALRSSPWVVSDLLSVQHAVLP